MSRFGRLNKSADIFPGSAICCDCGVDTMPKIKPANPRSHEQFIVKNEIWAAAGMPPGKMDWETGKMTGGGFLCVGCIEARLGRRLTIADFWPFAIPELLSSPWATERLRSRWMYRTQAEEDAAKLAPPIKWTADFSRDGFGMMRTIDTHRAETSTQQCAPI